MLRQLSRALLSFRSSQFGKSKLRRGRTRVLRRRAFFELLEDRRMLATITWDGDVSNLWSNALNWNTNTVPVAGDDVVLPASTAPYSVTLDVSYPSGGGLDSLTVSSDASLGSDFNGETLTIENSIGIQGSFGLANSTFNLNGNLDNAGLFQLSASTFNFNSGTLSNNAPILISSALNIAPGATALAEFRLQGNGTLSGDVSATQTIRVEAIFIASAYITAATGFTNDGTIVLEDSSGNSARDAALIVDSGTLVNSTSGVITVSSDANPNAGQPDRNISANVTNNGLINLNEDTFFTKAGAAFTNNGTVNIAAGKTLVLSGLNQVFNQDAGTVSVGGGLTMSGDTFNFNGGSLSGNAPVLISSTLNIGAGSTGAGEFRMQGAGSLSGNIAQAQTVRVEATFTSNSVVTAASGFTNNGTLLIEDTSGGSARDAILVVSTGMLVNGPTGEITFLPDAIPTAGAGDRQLYANLTNNGTLNVDEHVFFLQANAALTNNAALNVAAGKVFVISGTNQVLNQAAGTMDIAGEVTLNGDSLNLTGGTIEGGGSASLTASTMFGVGSAGIDINNIASQVNPGVAAATTGILNIVQDGGSGTGGDYTHTNGVLNIELGGSDPGTGYDQLNVAGNAVLSGAINVSTIGGFLPSPCQTFDVVTYGSRTGANPTITGLDLGGGLKLRPVYQADRLTLVAYNDSVPINVDPTSVNISEGGAPAGYSVCLASPTPPTDVVTVSANNDSEASLSATTLTFNPATNWDLPQEVTVTAVDDNVVEGGHAGIITHTSSSGDPNFDNAAISDVTANITDNDAATVSFSLAASDVVESAATHTVDVALDIPGGGILGQPVSVDVVDLLSGSASQPGDYTFNTQTVTFPIGAASGSQTVGMSVSDDSDVEGDETVKLGLTNLNDGTSGQISIAAPDDHTVTILDDDTGGNPPLILSLSNSSPGCGGAAAEDLVTISATFSDPDSGETHSASINWGDGTTTAGTVDVNAGTVTASHAYSDGGIYTITVTLDDGQESDVETTVAQVSGVGLHDGELQAIGTDGVDRVRMDRRGRRIRMTASFDGGARQRFAFDANAVDSILAVLCGGDDRFRINRRISKPAAIDGGAGDDDLRGGRGDDTIRGGPGNDILAGRRGDDVLSGGLDNDWLRGGRGNDTLSGDEGNDTLRGNRGDDVLRGGGDNDALHGGRGNDILLGESGSDLLRGGRGRDLLIGGLDADILFGSRGDDILIGGTTTHDANDAALTAILGEWTSSNPYLTRVSNIRTGGGSLGGIKLEAGITVMDDNATDILVGNRGRDWFFADLDGQDGDDDLLLARRRNELVDLL